MDPETTEPNDNVLTFVVGLGIIVFVAVLWVFAPGMLDSNTQPRDPRGGEQRVSQTR